MVGRPGQRPAVRLLHRHLPHTSYSGSSVGTSYRHKGHILHCNDGIKMGVALGVSPPDENVAGRWSLTTDLLKPGLDAGHVKDVFAGELQDLVVPLVLGLAHWTLQLVFYEGFTRGGASENVISNERDMKGMHVWRAVPPSDPPTSDVVGCTTSCSSSHFFDAGRRLAAPGLAQGGNSSVYVEVPNKKTRRASPLPEPTGAPTHPCQSCPLAPREAS